MNIKKQIEDTENDLKAMLNGQNSKDQEDSKDTSKKSTTEEEDVDDEDEEEEDDEDTSEDDESEDDEESDDDDEDDESDEDDDESEDEDDESEDDDEDDSDDDEDDTKSKSQKRQKDGDKMIPSWKMQAALKTQEKRLRKELSKQSGKKDVDLDLSDDEDVEDFVKTTGLKPEVATELIKGLTKIVAKKMGITELQDSVRANKEQEGFNNEWSGSTKFVKKIFPNIKGKELESIKRKVHDLAFTKKYQHLSIKEIIRLEKKNLLSSKVKSFDKHRNGTKKAVTTYDLDNPDSIDFENMDMATFESVSNALAKRHGGKSSKIQRSKRI